MKRILILLTVFSLLLCALAAADSFTGTCLQYAVSTGRIAGANAAK